MSTPWRTAVALIGQAILLACPAQLQALTTLSEFRTEITPCKELGGDALSFHTPEAKGLVLADSRGRIGAVLLHSKTRRDNIEELTKTMQSLITHNKPAEVLRSADGHSALILYPDISREHADSTKSLTGCNRLTALHNVRNSYNASITPHYWHESGISLRNYDNRTLLYEITLDMSAEQVGYVEIRIGKKAAHLLKPHMLIGIPPSLPTAPRQVRRISYLLGGTTPIHADESTDTYLCRGTDEVYTLGTQQRLQQAAKKRQGIKHYFFPGLPMPNMLATISPVSPEKTPTYTEQPPPAAAPQAAPPPLSPSEARQRYIDELQKM